MKIAFRILLATVLLATPLFSNATASPAPCPREEVDAHVMQEYGIYGPQSVRREYFGFIYQRGGQIESAIVESRACRNPDLCVVNTTAAASQIPSGATVLGEWHTHPHNGARGLSVWDVHGAHNNRHIKCYAAYYSNPVGDIFAWDPQDTSVPTAMNSRVLIGSYLEQQERGQSSLAGILNPQVLPSSPPPTLDRGDSHDRSPEQVRIQHGAAQDGSS